MSFTAGTELKKRKIAACAAALSLFLLFSPVTKALEPAEDPLCAEPAVMEQAVRNAMEFSLTDFAEELAVYDLSVYQGYADAWEVFARMAERIADEPFNALRRLCIRYGIDEEAVAIHEAVRHPDWKEAAALYRVYGDGLGEVLARTAVIDIEKAEGIINIRIEYPPFDEIACVGTREEFMNARFGLAYLRTVYDEKGDFLPYETYLFEAEYLDSLIHPLGEKYIIKNGWYSPRSKSTRLHTGTDIKAPAKTPIKSVTDGVVLYIGTMDIPGNFVIIRDRYGFEYHYYHMFELTTFVEEGQIVKRGDVIGLVGCTGNSDANHLHLAVISPEFIYVNPYDMFLAADIRPIRVNGKVLRP